MKNVLRKSLTAPRWVSFPIVVGALVGLVAVCYPGGLSAAYVDLRDAGDLNRKLNACQTRDQEMQSQISDTKERMEYKEELITALIRGHATFAAVTDEFAALNHDQEATLTILRLRHGELNETELAAMSVIDYVRIRVGVEEGESSVVLSRLVAEFEQRFGHTPRGL